jgi:hypothetical protein
MTPIPAKIDSGLWHQYYFQTERGQVGLAADRRGIARMRPTFERPAMAFDNPDYVDVVIHSYRHGLGLAPGYPPCEEIERKQIGQRDRDRHLATQRGICRLELDHFDDLLVRHKLHKAAMVRVVCAVVLPVPVGAAYVSEIRNEPPSRASNACTWQVMPLGTFHFTTARASRSAR